VFPSPNGKPYSRAHISWVWRKAAKALLRREGQKYLTAEDGPEQKPLGRLIEAERIGHEDRTRRPCRGFGGENLAPSTIGKALPYVLVCTCCQIADAM
jgi:hypothetical protein